MVNYFVAQIQKLKHSITKGDKKKKKEVTEQIARLEAELDARHEQELKELKQGKDESLPAGVSEVGDSLGQLALGGASGDVTGGPLLKEMKNKKPSKAQKRRDKKAAQESEREARIEEQEIENLTSSRHLEAVQIKTLLAQRGLQIHEIPSDGNCLYAAVCHQMKLRDMESSNDSLRQKVAQHMRNHEDSFLPFLTQDNGDCFTHDDFVKYCDDLENTPAWGGQLEIRALSSVLQTPVEVIQAEGPPILSGEEFPGKPFTLTYYRHAYGLGEHYHSVEQKEEEKEDEFT